MYHEHLEKVVAFASADQFRDELIKSKADYFGKTGEIHDDDRSFELRMAGFLDWFIFDRPLAAWQKTPIRLFLDFEGAKLTTPEITPFREFTRTVHSLFEVRKVKDGEVRVTNLADGVEHKVAERRHMAAVEKGDLLEARLIPFTGALYFSRAFVFHPREVRKPILAELKRRKKSGQPPVDQEMVWLLSRMALKTERYTQIAVENIYRFDGKGL